LSVPGALTVLDISEYYGETSGGVRTYLTEKSRYVAARPPLAQVLVVPGADDGMRQAGSVRHYTVRGPVIPGQAPYRVMYGAGRVARIVAEERPDLIELGSAYLAPWVARAAARRSGIPLVWFYHGNLPRIIAPALGAAPAPGRWLAAAAARYVAAIGRRAERTLVATDFVRADLERFGVDRVTRVPLGVDADTFHPARRERRAETRRHFGLDDGPLALYTGRLTTEKQLDVAIAGWRRLRHREATLLLIGTGPLEFRLRRMAAASRVRFRSFEHDRVRLADLYAAADLYLAPGPAETFGLSAHEAMASGTPVLSVDSGGVAEQVHRSGAGAVYPLGDAAALAEAADALLDADLAALGARARAFVEAHHRWDRVFDRIFGIYREVAGR
jgi:alpha-1,6-mannosyltransferase